MTIPRGAGRFYDGETAGRREVAVEIAPEGLRILDPPDDRELAFWRYRELRPVDEVVRDGPLRIRTTRSGRGRLVLASPALIATLTVRAPRLAAGKPGWAGLGLRWAILTVLSVAGLVVLISLGLPRVADRAARLVPNEWEAAFGERLVKPVVRQLAWLDDTETAAFCTAPRGRDALAGLSRRLAPAGTSDRFRIRIVNLEMINAFALPGGQILITDGLLRFARSPDEVAGVLAHEMGHVIHRHTTAAMIEALGLAFLFGVMLGDLGTGTIGWAGETLIGLSFRRDAEAQADRSAIELLRRAGVSSRGLADFFERLEEKAGEVPSFLRPLTTHPPTASRRRIAARAATDAEAPALAQDEWRALRAICRRQEPLDPP